MIEHHRLAQQLKIIPVEELILINKNRSSSPDLLLELYQGILVDRIEAALV
jgi:hypothetical protein